ncbi:MAG: YjgP/YjgQ family permease [Kiritimatiellaceae bacterium]|nr:MAG: YjgP/YjgQ family permease [Kiritimatiellaceae bacterium]|tara:strand:+ start:1494 stop:2621 length:1128 start_codon:yes stop_codon:yes gene_type:complete
MGRLSRYVLGDFLVMFGVALLVVTFAMCLGAIYQVVDVMARGVDAATVGGFFLNNLPYTLSYSVPISVLFSTLLLFGRLSAESELSAMKSGGLSVWQVAAPLVVLAVVLSGLCLWNNGYVYPRTEYANRTLLKNMGVEDPVKLLDEGRFIRDFPGYMIYVGKKSGSGIEDLVFYELGEGGREIEQSIWAKRGEVTRSADGAFITVMLEDVRIEVADEEHPDDSTKAQYLAADRFPITLDVSAMAEREVASKKRRNMTLDELLEQIEGVDARGLGWSAERVEEERTRWRVHLHQRFYLGLAPLTFVLVGIPLGIRSHRRESSAGMVLSLVVMFIFYLLMIVADSLESKPAFFPWLIPWGGTLVAQVGGLLLIRRMN